MRLRSFSTESHFGIGLSFRVYGSEVSVDGIGKNRGRFVCPGLVFHVALEDCCCEVVGVAGRRKLGDKVGGTSVEDLGLEGWWIRGVVNAGTERLQPRDLTLASNYLQ